MKEIRSLSEIPMEGAVALDFFATWCGPCKAIAPTFEKLAAEFPSVTFLKVDVDQAGLELREKWGIRSVPTFVFLRKGGKLVKKVEGGDLNSIISVLEVLADEE
jgi:thioredoxin 1